MTESNQTDKGSREGRRLRIGITGTGGRLGGALKRIYSERYDVTAFDRSNLDLEDGRNVREILAGCNFDVLINPGAITSVDACEFAPEAAMAVNALAPEVMSQVCRESGARFIHVSTDYVFDGVDGGLRREGEPTRPLGVYGKTKREGELRVLAADPEALVVRTSWVFGPERQAFPDSIIARALECDQVEAIADKWSSPTYADDFGRYLEPLLLGGTASGILHLCNSGSCSWQEYGQEALDLALRFGLDLKAKSVGALSLSDMEQFVVPRPVHTAMDTSLYTALGHGEVRPWKEALAEYLEGEVQAGKFSPS